MQYEVEQKFPVADMGAVEAGVAALGAGISPPQQETDLYFAHPAAGFRRHGRGLTVAAAGGRRATSPTRGRSSTR